MAAERESQSQAVEAVLCESLRRHGAATIPELVVRLALDTQQVRQALAHGQAAGVLWCDPCDRWRVRHWVAPAPRPKPAPACVAAPGARFSGRVSPSRHVAHWCRVLELAIVRGSVTSVEVARRLPLPETRRACSLLRRMAASGYLVPVEKVHAGGRRGGPIWSYAITPRGRAWLAEQSQAKSKFAKI